MLVNVIEYAISATLALYVGTALLNRLVVELTRRRLITVPLIICSNCAVTTASWVHPRCGGALCPKCSIWKW
jgi:hypothetical protein